MDTRKACTIGVGILFILGAGSGCASHKAHKMGQRLLAQEAFDDAVTSFQDAHNLAPNNKKYFEAWLAATEQAIAWHRSEAQGQLRESMLAPALSHIQKGISYSGSGTQPIPGQPSKDCRTACGLPKGEPGHPHSLKGVITVDEAELENLESVIANAMRDATERTDVGQEQMGRGLWDQAVATLREATNMDRSSQRASELLQSSIEGAIRYHLSVADDHLRAERWDACETECSIVTSYDPRNRESQRLRTLANDRERARELQADARQLVTVARHMDAIDILQEAVGLWVEDESIAADFTRAKNLAADKLVQAGTGLVRQARYAEALSALDRASAIVPDRLDVRAAVTQTESTWAESLLAEGQDASRGGDIELAWVKSVQAVGISPEHDGGRTALDRHSSSIHASLDCSIAVIPASSGTGDQHETVRACAMMGNALRTMAPPHVKLVERMNLRDILDEHDLAFAGILRPEALERIARGLGNADFLLLISTATRSNDAQVVERQGAARFVAGTKLVSNPAYAEAQQELQAAQQALSDARTSSVGMSLLGGLLGTGQTQGHRLLGTATSGLGHAGTQSAHDRYNTAVLRVSQTPQLIPVPDERVYHYPVVRVTRTATVTVDMRLVDVRTAQVVWDEESLAFAVEQSDTYVKPAPQYGVPGKQALLSEAQELYAEAIERLQPSLVDAAERLMSRRSEGYLIRGNRAATDSQRMAWYVRFLFDPGPSANRDTINDTLQAVLHSGTQIDAMRLRRAERFALVRLGLAP